MNRSTMSRSTMSRVRFLAAAAAGALAVALVPAGPAEAAPAAATGRPAFLPDRIELPVGWQPEGIRPARAAASGPARSPAAACSPGTCGPAAPA